MLGHPFRVRVWVCHILGCGYAVPQVTDKGTLIG